MSEQEFIQRNKEKAKIYDTPLLFAISEIEKWQSTAKELAEKLDMINTALEIHSIIILEKDVDLNIVSKELQSLQQIAESALQTYKTLTDGKDI